MARRHCQAVMAPCSKNANRSITRKPAYELMRRCIGYGGGRMLMDFRGPHLSQRCVTDHLLGVKGIAESGCSEVRVGR